MPLTSPDIQYPDRSFSDYRKNWSAHPSLYINDLHSTVYEMTSHMEGWQAQGDSEKLFEMGYYSGDALLEVGVYGGRSATVALMGALSNQDRKEAPQFYGIDISLTSIKRSLAALRSSGLEKYCLLYWGNFGSFATELSVSPTSVFIDGDHSYSGVKEDCKVLSHVLAPNTPVLFHDFRGPAHIPDPLPPPPPAEELTGETMWLCVQNACNEWEQAGYGKFLGTSGCSGLYLSTSLCRGRASSLSPTEFDTLRSKLHARYDELPEDAEISSTTPSLQT